MAAAERGLLSNRAFLAIWAAQILSQVASNAVTSALIILVAELTHSNTSSSLLILLAVLPAVLFGIAGGVIVDRTDRRLVMIVTNALRAASIVPLLLFVTSLTVVYLVAFLVATVSILFVPAEAATIPSIDPPLERSINGYRPLKNVSPMCMTLALRNQMTASPSVCAAAT